MNKTFLFQSLDYNTQATIFNFLIQQDHLSMAAKLLFYWNTFIYLCVCARAHSRMCVCMCVCVEARGHQEMFSSITFHLVF